MRYLTLTLFLIGGVLPAIQAQDQIQQVFNSTGGSVKQGNFDIEWSIGELALVNQMETSNQSLILTNGFLQPFTNLVSRKEKSYFEPADIKILPNPTRDIIEINFFTQQQGTMTVTLFNDLGKTLYKGDFMYYGHGQYYKLNMSALANGVYTLYIYLDPLNGQTRKVGSFRVVKID